MTSVVVRRMPGLRYIITIDEAQANGTGSRLLTGVDGALLSPMQERALHVIREIDAKLTVPEECSKIMECQQIG